MEFVLAYIDPGSGSLVIQALIAAVVAIPLFFRNQIGRAIRAARGPRSEPTTTSHGQDEGARPD